MNMNDNQNIIASTDNRREHNALLAKWLHTLFLLQIAAVVITCFNSLQLLSGLAAWCSRAVSIGVLVVFFQLAPANARYRKAGIWMAVSTVGSILYAFMQISLLSLLVSISSIVVTYQQYEAHSEVTEALDPKLSHNWHSLFWWQMCVGLLSGFASVAGVVIGVSAGAESAAIVFVVTLAVGALSVIMEVIALIFMKKTYSLFADREA